MKNSNKNPFFKAILLVIVLPALLSGQPGVDSLKKILPSLKGEERLNTLISLSQQNIFADSKQSKNYAEEALTLARQLGSEDKIAQSYYFLGFSKYRSGNHTQALNDLYKSTAGYNNLKDYNSMAMAKNLIAIIYYYIGRYEIAVKIYSQNLVYYKSKNMLKDYSKMLTNLATVFIKKGDYDKALENLLAAETAFKQYAPDDNYLMGNLKCNIGEAYFGKKEYELALKNYFESVEYLNKINLTDGVANTQMDIGITYLEMKKYTHALEYFNYALKNYTGIKYTKGIMDAKENIVNYYKTIKQYGNALEEIRGLEAMSAAAEDTIMLAKCYNHYADIYETENNYSASSKYFRKYLTLKNNIEKETGRQNMIGFQVFADAEEKEMENLTLRQENEIQKEKIERNRILYYAVIGGLILLSAFLFILYKEEKTARKYAVMLEKKNEEINIQNIKLEEVIQAKDKFFSILAHNLKNPFWAILGLNSILEESYDELPDDEKKNIITHMGSSFKNVYKLFEDLLSWAKTQQSAIKPNKEILDAAVLVNNSIKPYEARANEKNVNISVNAESGISISADKFMLETIVGNFVDNAIKFSKVSSDVMVSVTRGEKNVSISIEDNGIGMPADKVEKLFKIDEVVTSEGTMREKGTGLGLIICKEFVKLNGGEIIVESVEGKGTKFTINLPVE